MKHWIRILFPKKEGWISGIYYRVELGGHATCGWVSPWRALLIWAVLRSFGRVPRKCLCLNSIHSWHGCCSSFQIIWPDYLDI
jgi:hypothetical protein